MVLPHESGGGDGSYGQPSATTESVEERRSCVERRDTGRVMRALLAITSQSLLSLFWSAGKSHKYTHFMTLTIFLWLHKVFALTCRPLWPWGDMCIFWRYFTLEINKWKSILSNVRWRWYWKNCVKGEVNTKAPFEVERFAVFRTCIVLMKILSTHWC